MSELVCAGSLAEGREENSHRIEVKRLIIHQKRILTAGNDCTVCKLIGMLRNLGRLPNFSGKKWAWLINNWPFFKDKCQKTVTPANIWLIRG